MPDDTLPTLPADVRETFTTTLIGGTFRHVPVTGSTNDDLKIAARAGAREGTVLSTDEQTAGRGRRGRTWSAPAGSSLLVSTLLRPVWLPAADAFYLTILAAVACAEAVEEVTALPITLKWPNDLHLTGRKLGGILVESELSGEELQWAIIGIGLNVNWNPTTLPEIATTATGLAPTLNRPIARIDLLGALLRRLDERYTRLRSGARAELYNTWRTRLSTLGQHVRVDNNGQVFDGIAEGVTHTGALVVHDAAGTRHELTAGEVTVRTTDH